MKIIWFALGVIALAITFTLIFEDKITGLIVGDFSLSIRTVSNYYNDSVIISNGNSISYGNTSITFGTGENSTGSLNLTIDSLNPVGRVADDYLSTNIFIILNSNLTFNNATIGYTYREEQISGMDESTLRIFRYNSTSSNWVKLAGGVIQGNNTVYGITPGFSNFAVFGQTNSSSDNSDNGGENSVESVSSGGGGGTSGGAIRVPSLNDVFRLIPESISATLDRGEFKKEQITLTNLKDYEIEVNLTSNLPEIIDIQQSVKLAPLESKSIEVTFLATEESPGGLNAGKITASWGGLQEEILVAASIQDKNSLLDVGVKIPNKFHSVPAGDTLLAEISLYNFGKTERVDVLIIYEIRDKSNEFISRESETLAIQTQNNFVKEINVPSHLPKGDYLLNVRANCAGTEASGSAWFKVTETKSLDTTTLLIFAGFVVMIVILGLVLIIHERTNKQIVEKIVRRR